MTLTRTEIVEAAVDVLGEVGFEGLTLRRLGKHLGVSAPTLYWHVDDKRHLLDLMVEVIYGRSEVRLSPKADETIWEWLAANARAQRDTLLSIRDAALVVAGNRPTEDTLPWIEGNLTTFLQHGIQPARAIQIIRILHDYVIGSAIETQSLGNRTPTAHEGHLATRLGHSDEFPLVVSAVTESADYVDDLFELGLRWFIAGVRREFEDAGIRDSDASL